MRTCDASSTNAETPRAPAVAGSVRAKRRNVPARDPFVIHCFEPVDPPAVAVRLGRRPQRARVRPRSGLGERERADLLPSGERRHEACALLLGPEAQDRERRRARVHGDRDPHARVRPRELLEHEDVREEVRARAAVLLRNADAHQPELCELREELVREPVLPVPGGGVRRDLRVRELAGEPLDLALVGGELEVHRRDYRDAAVGARHASQTDAAGFRYTPVSRTRRSRGRSCGRACPRPRTAGGAGTARTSGLRGPRGGRP